MNKESYENLANAIIERAIKDYIRAKKRLKKYPNSEAAQMRVKEILGFFHSKWFMTLTDIDPNRLIDKIHKEVFDIDNKAIFKTGKIS